MTIDFVRSVPVRLAARLALVAHIALAGFALMGVQAHAAPRAGAYVASLATPLAVPKQEIMGGVLWKCAGDRCSALAEGSRPLLVCERVARKFGQVAKFSSPMGELTTEELTRCNGAG